VSTERCDPVPLSNAGRTVMTFPVISGKSSALMEFQFEVSAHIIPQDIAHRIPQLRVNVSPLVWSSQGVLRYTDLATPVRQACGMVDGWQRVDRVSYAKCAPVITRRAFGGDRSPITGGNEVGLPISRSRPDQDVRYGLEGATRRAGGLHFS
jgi:hypothetical protein